MKLRTVLWVGTTFALLGLISISAEDWPQWRFDASRTANSPEDLPANLHLQWVRQYSPRAQVWDDPLNHDLMSYDRVFEPVVMGDRMFVGFNDRDKLVALDIHTGRELWTFFTDGPVRLPPTAGQGRVYCVSDDGFLYCLNAATGSLLWKFQGAPAARKVLGNGRVISAWPARGGPVLRDGQVYFAASIWPFMGTFIYALDAATGRVIWENDGTGAEYLKQPHSAPAFAGVAPQGALVATRDLLLVPGGRSVPAGFDRKTGRLLFFNLDDGGKGNGGSFVAASETDFFVHTRLRGTRSYELRTGKKGTYTINEPVLATNALYSGQEHSSLKAAVIDAEQKLAAARQTQADERLNLARALDDADRAAYKKATNALATALKKVAQAEATLLTAQKALATNWPGNVIQAVGRDKKLRWEFPAEATGEIIQSGHRLYAAVTNAIIALDIPSTTNRQPRLAWSNAVDAPVMRLLAANRHLFAVTLDGRIMAFGPQPTSAPTLAEQRPPVPVSPGAAREGYALWFGVDDGQLLRAVLLQSQLHIIAVDPDPAKIDLLRRRFDAAGLYGTRVALHTGDPLTFKAPPYIASLIVVGAGFAPRLAQAKQLQAVYESLRPYGGKLWISTAQAPQELRSRLQSVSLPQASWSAAPDGLTVARLGPLPGSASWTHQYGDVANTVKSDDQLVKLPLGVLWFGGNTHQDVLPRHGHGPSEQIAGGRLFIEGMNSLSARDVYTGRVLWKTELPGLGNEGIYYDSSYTNAPLSTAYNQKHIPGANARGANYVVTEDELYVAAGPACRVLDARTGKITRTLELPPGPDDTFPPDCGYLGVEQDVLLAGTGFAQFTTRLGLLSTNRLPAGVDWSASRGLVAFNRHTGQILWRVQARHSFLHNGIVAGGGRLYCIDKLPRSIESKLRRRGRTPPADFRIAAFDLRDGRLLWEVTTNVFGTWLAFSRQYDVLLQAGASAIDRLRDEAEKGMAVYRAADGSLLWKNLDLKYTGPCILHHDTILTTPTSYKTNAGAFALLDGQQRLLVNPLTRQPEPWRIYRTYGCNYPIACEHLLTFRSGAAGFYDLETHSGTGNFGGFKSGCSPNLIAADGVLNAPDYTRTCTCPYQNQTSLALVHMPDLELWTHNQFGLHAKEGQRVERVGINFGAPGDRKAPSGTLWIEHPASGGTSPYLSVVVKGRTNYFRHHASRLSGEGPAWVMASGVRDPETILIGPETRRRPPPPAAPKKKAGDDDDDDDNDKNGKDSETANGKKSGPENSASTATNHTEVASTSTNTSAAVYQSSLAPAPYTVRLYFAEPDNLRPGQRVFNVQLQDRPVLRNFDIAAAAGAPLRGVIKEFRSVIIKDQLAIKLTRAPGQQYGPVLCGVELLLETALAGELAMPGGN